MKKLLFTIFFLPTLLLGSWDVEGWTSFKATNWKNDLFKIFTLGELRINEDISKTYYYRLGEGISYKVYDWLTFEFHYSYIRAKSVWPNTPYTTRHRFEFELNPWVKLCNYKIEWRNRLEIVKTVGAVRQPHYIFRHRITLTYPPCNCQDKKCQTTLSSSEEIFYNFNTHYFFENRFVPLRLTFPIVDEKTLAFYIMARNVQSSAKWYRSIVLGTDFNF